MFAHLSNPQKIPFWTKVQRCFQTQSDEDCNGYCSGYPRIIGCNDGKITEIRISWFDLHGSVNLDMIPVHVTEVRLNRNRITDVIITDLRDSALKYLSLEGNELTEFNWSGLKRSQIRTLRLGFNQINNIDFTALEGANNLELISVFQNDIESVDFKGLKEIQKLKSLSLLRNQIQTVKNEKEISDSSISEDGLAITRTMISDQVNQQLTAIHDDCNKIYFI